jgi:hypothetical protein
MSSTSNTKMPATSFAIIGIILVIAGLAIIYIPGMPFRGSGLGTISVIIGAVLVAFPYLKGFMKSTRT